MGRVSNRKWMKRANNLKLDFMKFREPHPFFKKYLAVSHPHVFELHHKLSRALSLIRRQA